MLSQPASLVCCKTRLGSFCRIMDGPLSELGSLAGFDPERRAVAGRQKGPDDPVGMPKTESFI